jgi:hypothetical protein
VPDATSLSNPGVEAEEDEIGDGLPSRQCARQMDGVQGTDRLGGKGAARPFGDLFVGRQQRPSGGYRVEAGLAVDRIRFTKLDCWKTLCDKWVRAARFGV